MDGAIVRVALGDVHLVSPPSIARRRTRLGDLAHDCSAGDAAACTAYYATVYSQAPSVILAAQQAAQKQPPPLPPASDIPVGCPVVSGSGASAICNLPSGNILCSAIRECDPMTGAVHYEYAMPYPTGNVDILEVNPTGVVSGYQGSPAGSPSAPQPIATGTQIEQSGVATYRYPGIAVASPPTPPQKTTSGSGVSQTDVHGTQQTGAGTGSTGGNSSSSSTSVVGFALPAFLTDTMIYGIPNWLLIVAAGAAVFFMVKK